MKRLIHALICLILVHSLAVGQDPRRPPANPTTPKSGGSGGIDFGGKTKTEELPNPYIFNAALTVVAQAIPLAIKQKNLELDEEKSQPRNGLFVTKMLVFAHGLAVSKAELQHVAILSAEESHGWASGRYSLEVSMSPVTATTMRVTVRATIEGLAQDVLSSKWVKAESRGVLENEFLLALRQLVELQ